VTIHPEAVVELIHQRQHIVLITPRNVLEEEKIKENLVAMYYSTDRRLVRIRKCSTRVSQTNHLN
jgi:hypothetical protein